MYRVSINGKSVDLERKISGSNLRIIDLINNTEDNIQRIISAAMRVGQLPFRGSHKALKTWLIANQGYDKYVAEVYYYYVEKCRI